MTVNYKKYLNIVLFFNLLAVLISCSSLIYGYLEYIKHFINYGMIATGVGIILILGNISVYLFNSNMYKQSLARNIFFILLLIIIYTFVERIFLITMNRTMFIGSSFIMGPFVLVLSFFISSKFNNEYRELVELKNSLEIKVDE